MIFNGIEKSYIKLTRGIVRPFFAPLERESKFDNPLIQTDRGHRVIEVPIWIEYEGVDQLPDISEDLAGWLVHNDPKILQFRDDPDRFYYAVVDDTMIAEEPYGTGSESTITFIAGYKYSHERKILIESPTTENIVGHKSTKWRSKTVFKSGQTGYELQFSSPGKSDLFDIGKIKLNYNFTSGDVLEIDYSKRKITLNGIDRSNTLVILQSNWIELPIGQVNFTADQPTEIYYNERYY